MHRAQVSCLSLSYIDPIITARGTGHPPPLGGERSNKDHHSKQTVQAWSKRSDLLDRSIEIFRAEIESIPGKGG